MTVSVEFMNKEWFQQEKGNRIDGNKFTINPGEDKHFGGPGSVSLIVSCNEADDGGTLKLFQGTHGVRNSNNNHMNIVWPEPIVTAIKEGGVCDISGKEQEVVIIHKRSVG